MSNATNSKDRLESILDQVRVLKAKYDERAEVTGENFNVFSILDRESDEVKTHSAFIAELLNPHGSHSQGTLFLKLFLNQLKLFLDQLLKKFQEEQKAQEKLKQLRELREKLEQIQEDQLDKFKVGVEVSFESFEKKEGKEQKKRSQIDILIESGDVCVVIENKIYAEDQQRQLGRYYEYALDTRKKLGIIYLTLEGDEPKEFTLYGGDPNEFYGEGKISPSRRLPKDTVICLSYKDFIDEWLGTCIKEVARIPQIRETLHQYQMTVRKLTGRLTGKLPSKVEDILNTDTALKNEIIKHLQCEFWRELKKRLADKKPKFQLYNSRMKDIEILDDKLKENICHPSLGLTFSIPDSLADKGHEVAFRVYYERSQTHSYFNYGFVFRTKDTLQREKIEQPEEAIKRYVISEKHQDPNNGWISWKYFPYEPGNFITESKETLIRKLISEINLALVETR